MKSGSTILNTCVDVCVYLDGTDEMFHQIPIKVYFNYYVYADIKYAGDFSVGNHMYQIKFDVWLWTSASYSLVNSIFFLKTYSGSNFVNYLSQNETVQIVKPLYVHNNGIRSNPSTISSWSVRIDEAKYHVQTMFYKQLELVRGNTVTYPQQYLADTNVVI